jgi:hypothetical protein
MGALSAMYEEDILQDEVARDEIDATWTSAIGESALRAVLRALAGGWW